MRDEPTQEPPPVAQHMRTFSLNSPEAYEILCGGPDPWLWGPCLPREPRGRKGHIIIERR